MSADTRRILHSAYSFVRGVESNRSVSSLTMDHLLQEHITNLKKGEVRQILDGRGESVGKRSSKYDDLEELEKGIDEMTAAVRSAGDDQEKLARLGLSDSDPETEDA